MNSPSEQKQAIVTGASTGIGRAIAIALGTRGFHVGLVARNLERLQQTAKLVTAEGGKATILPTDLRRDVDLQSLSAQINKEWKYVDSLVHVAGIWHNHERAYAGVPLHEMAVEEIDEVFEVGLRAPILLTKLLLPLMIQRRRGKILNISGTFASGGAGWLHYYVSKLALEHFTVGLAQEVRKHGIQVNCISPSDVATEALKRFFPDDAKTALHPSDVAEFAAVLLSPQADHITGQIVVIKNKEAY